MPAIVAAPRSARLWILTLATLAYLASFAVWTVLGPILPLLAERYLLSATQASTVVTASVLLGAIVRIPIGVLADRYGATRVFAALLFAIGLVTVLAATSGSYASWLFAAAAIGLTAGGMFAVGVPLIAAWFPPTRQGTALGVFGMGNAGGALGALAAPAIASAWGVPAVLLLFSVPVLAIATLFVVFHRMHGGHTSERRQAAGTTAPAPRAGIGATAALLWRQPAAGVLGLFSLVTFGGYLGLVVHLPLMLVRTYGLAPASAGSYVAGLSVAATIARPLGGFAADRLGGARVLFVVFPVVSAVSLALATSPDRFLLSPMLLALGVAMGLGNGAGIKLVPLLFPAQSGAVGGLVGALGALGGLALPLAQAVSGDFITAYGFCFVLLALLAAIALVLDVTVIAKRSA